MAGIKGIAISICSDCSVRIDEERVTLGVMLLKQRKDGS
jgi:hypothetical protein